MWEFGLGAGAIAFEDYRGSDTTHAYPLPVPYIVYNGEFLKADRDGMRGTLFNQDRLEINLSFNLTTPVRNDPNAAACRTCDPRWRLGPLSICTCLAAATRSCKLDLRMPLRAAATVELIAACRRLDLHAAIQSGHGGSLGIQWLEARFVDGPAVRRIADTTNISIRLPRNMRPRRGRSIQAEGGYAGTQMLAALSKRYPKFWMGAYMRYDTLAGAVFLDSPLVQRRSYWIGGIRVRLDHPAILAMACTYPIEGQQRCRDF